MAKSMSDYMTAPEACAVLEIKRASLYSYTSRGFVRSVPSKGKRARLYLRSDVLRLRERHDARSGHGAVAAGALRWGEAVLDSSITEIRTDGPRYRGVAAVELAHRGVSFERVAEFLWTGTLRDAVSFAVPNGVSALIGGLPAQGGAYECLAALALAMRAKDRLRSSVDRVLEIERARAYLAAASLVPFRMRRSKPVTREGSIAGRVLRAWGKAPTAKSMDAVNQALVIVADHELSASAFAARVVASTGADLYACLEGGLAACFGPLHGGECDRVEAFLASIRTASDARRAVRHARDTASLIPGFTHRLYPEGDPRTPPLLFAANRLGARARIGPALSLVRAMRAAGGEPPTVDIGLVVLCRALGLPPGAASYLFALGRVAGWVAHVLEQRDTNALVRPRARYVGRNDLAGRA